MPTRPVVPSGLALFCCEDPALTCRAIGGASLRDSFPQRACAAVVLIADVQGLYYCPSTSGRPFLGLPMITILVFWLSASFSVASMPFQVSSCSLMPAVTVF